MNLKPFHYSTGFRRKLIHCAGAAFLGKRDECGTQNKANRDAWLEHTLASISPGQRIMDTGAGELQYKRLCAHLDYVSQDFAQYDGKGNGVALQTDTWDQSQVDIVSDITNIPEPDASFDVVMCIEVLEHLADPIRALRELMRLLKPSGTLIITVPFCSLTHFSPHFYYTGYSRYFYEYWLGELGYEIDDIEWNGNFFEYLAQELRRLPRIGEKYAGMTATWLEKVAINIILRLLNRLSQNDNGSEQLLAYGLHIRARKRGT